MGEKNIFISEKIDKEMQALSLQTKRHLLLTILFSFIFGLVLGLLIGL